MVGDDQADRGIGADVGHSEFTEPRCLFSPSACFVWLLLPALGGVSG